MELILVKERCTQCRKCIAICHKGPLIFDIEKKEIKNTDYCNACLLCVSVCPEKALYIARSGQLPRNKNPQQNQENTI